MADNSITKRIIENIIIYNTSISIQYGGASMELKLGDLILERGTGLIREDQQPLLLGYFYYWSIGIVDDGDCLQRLKGLVAEVHNFHEQGKLEMVIYTLAMELKIIQEE